METFQLNARLWKIRNFYVLCTEKLLLKAIYLIVIERIKQDVFNVIHDFSPLFDKQTEKDVNQIYTHFFYRAHLYSNNIMTERERECVSSG